MVQPGPKAALALCLGVTGAFGFVLPEPTSSASQGKPLPPRQLEHLGRGVVALHQGGGKVFVSWRLLGTDPDDISFNIYRKSGDNLPIRVNKEPLRKATNFVEIGVDMSKPNAWFVRPAVNGEEQEPSAVTALSRLPANAPARPYLSIPLRTPAGYSPNDCSVGDLDGDGEYEIVVHQVGRGQDNSKAGVTTEPILEVYRLDGTFLWRINLGKNIREGAHYTQLKVLTIS